ncbi:MAG: DUF3820 family protein [Pseudomonadota bacterium]
MNKPAEDILPDPEFLLKLSKTRMPFGKYKNRLLIDLPEPYVVWFYRQGFPKGQLGELLAVVYEIKVNGLEYLFDNLRDSGKLVAGRKPYTN